MDPDLDASWTVWEQPPGGLECKRIVSFSNLEEFCDVWNRMPRPSQLLEGSSFASMESGKAHFISDLGIFRTHLQPEWEHHSGHFQIDLQTDLSGALVDRLWGNMVNGLVFGLIEPADIISGARMIDRRTRKSNRKPKKDNFVRIELWFRGDSPEARYTLKGSFEKVLRTQPDGSEETPTWSYTKIQIHDRGKVTNAPSHACDDYGEQDAAKPIAPSQGPGKTSRNQKCQGLPAVVWQ
eukprot:TRINITY_DN50483_c0_g1_i1.p1 TRINITY_DN50483_c0_g1~~TRINITY_DN50483_c0_g1_i1.p1  ORF type:complete len:250 (+),score=23.04 TRINITY_DN50483_c0_g1_i1:38-751(+)